MSERLDKIIASSCLLSRREAQECIRAGRVSAGGVVCRAPESKFDRESGAILLDGNPVSGSAHLYLMMYKPQGVLSATEDRDSPTAMDLLPPGYEKAKGRLAIVGRLDKDAEGLLLLTDDGELNHRLTHPRRHVEKRYEVRTDRPAGEEDVLAFSQGMDLGNFISLPAGLEIVENPNENLSFVSIKEGKFHQIKRMFENRGKKVIFLKRLKIGTLELDKCLKPGEIRPLSQPEVTALRHLAELI